MVALLTGWYFILFSQGQPGCPAYRIFLQVGIDLSWAPSVNEEICIYEKENLSIEDFALFIRSQTCSMNTADSPRMMGWNPGKLDCLFSDGHTHDSSWSSQAIVSRVTKHKDGLSSSCLLGKKNSEDQSMGLHTYLTVQRQKAILKVPQKTVRVVTNYVSYISES